jgi:hypothetical protein
MEQYSEECLRSIEQPHPSFSIRGGRLISQLGQRALQACVPLTLEIRHF